MSEQNAKLSEEQQKEAEKRAEEKKKWEKEAFSYWYYTTHGQPLFPRVDHPTKTIQQQLDEVDPDTPRMETDLTKSGLFADGRYQSGIPDLDFILKNGAVSWTKKPDAGDFEAYVKKTIDFLIVAKGTKSITLNWKDEKYVTEEKLMQIMKWAAEKGIEVKFGDNVQKFINSNRDETKFDNSAIEEKRFGKLSDHDAGERTKRIYDEQRKFGEAARLKRAELGYKENPAEYDELVADRGFKLRTESLKGNKKFPDAADDNADKATKKGNYKKAVLGDDTAQAELSKEDKIEKWKEEIASIKDRMEQVEDSISFLSKHIDERIKGLETPTQKKIERIEQKQSSIDNLKQEIHTEFADLKFKATQAIAELEALKGPPLQQDATEEQKAEAKEFDDYIKENKKIITDADRAITKLDIKADKLPAALDEAREKLAQPQPPAPNNPPNP